MSGGGEAPGHTGARLPTPTPGHFQMPSLWLGFRDREGVFARPPSTGRVICLKELMFLVLPLGKCAITLEFFFPTGDSRECQLQQPNVIAPSTCFGVKQTGPVTSTPPRTEPQFPRLFNGTWFPFHGLLCWTHSRFSVKAEAGSGDIPLALLDISYLGVGLRWSV